MTLMEGSSHYLGRRYESAREGQREILGSLCWVRNVFYPCDTFFKRIYVSVALTAFNYFACILRCALCKRL